jgi:copper(I)-binding protein
MRWTRWLLAAAIAILVPALAGCEAGYNAPTLEFHPASLGVSVDANGVSIDNLFVLGPPLNVTLPVGGQAGVFLALHTYNSGERLLAVAAPGTATSATLTNGPVTLEPGTLVNLSGPSPEIVLNGLTTPLTGGQTIELVLTFANAGAVTVMVPVMPNAYEYATFSPPPLPLPTPSPSPSASHTPHRTIVAPSVSATP